jgi:hypothetical protein
MESLFFWDIMLCSLLKVSQQFKGTYHLHLQGQRISTTRNLHEEGSRLTMFFMLVPPEH